MSVSKPTPNDMVKKDPTVNTGKDDTPDSTPEVEPKKDDNTPMIVGHTHYYDQDGVRQTKVHGPMPVSEWSAYEKEHNL